jgi:hypothetical protein
MYMSNTDSDVLLYIKSQEHYVLLAGRWYAGSKLQGPWQYVPGEELPPDFGRIPEDSEMGTVLYAVPGTDIAKEAVLDAQIPQTAAIDRKKATLSVEYDGEPKFEAIKGTKMAYAVNTAPRSSVLRRHITPATKPYGSSQTVPKVRGAWRRPCRMRYTPFRRNPPYTR